MNLNVYREARVFVSQIFTLVENWPEHEKHSLSNQIIRSSRSITANLAEGHGRYHFQENIQFCRIARASLVETQSHLICALDCRCITEIQFQTSIDQSEIVHKLLNGYITYLKGRKSASK